MGPFSADVRQLPFDGSSVALSFKTRQSAEAVIDCADAIRTIYAPKHVMGTI